ncbi:MAG TPA: glycosyltransferase [Actinomycetota bacterium]|nr:glycosyltransferase [Actinomycetota bacterium]
MARDTEPIRLLFFAHAMQSRGTERAVIRILREIDRTLVRPELALVSHTGEFVDDVPDDVPVHRLGLEGQKTSKAAGSLNRLLNSVDPDVAVGVHTSASRLLSALRPFHPRLPIVCFEADPFSRVEGSKGSYGLRRTLTLITHRFLATRVVAVSDFVANDLGRELRIPASKLDVIPIPSVEPSMFDLAKEPLDDPGMFEVPVVISLGHMFEHKDQQTLVRAFAKVRSQVEARLVMVGDGPLRPRLEALAAELGVADSVVFIGFQRNPFRFLSRARVFVSPSASEGFDVSQVEAMACGVPVVVTDAPRFQAVTHEVNGLIVAPADPEAMASGIMRVLNEPELAASLVTAGERFASTLTSAKIARRWEALLLELTGRSQAPPS